MIKSITPMYFIIACLLAITSPILKGQNLQTIQASIINDLDPATNRKITNISGLGKTGSCGVDTLYYTWYKATLFNPLSLNTTTSGNIFAQWFSADQATTIAGFDFFAWQSAGTNAVIPLTCRVYAAGPDSLPFGLPLASVTVNVDSVFGGGVLSNLIKHAVFTTPVTVTTPYVITVETSSATNVSVVSNNWNTTTTSTPNGRGEWLSSVKIGNNFVRSYNVNVGGIIYDADFVFLPYASYTFDADFTISTCNSGGNQISFTNTSSSVFFNKFYNLYAFYNIAFVGCQWDYGDSSGIWTSLNGSRLYNHAIPYTVKLKDTLYGWRTGCVDVESKVVGTVPPAPMAHNNGPLCSGATLNLNADTIPGATYYWTGPNGFTSTRQNPTLNNAGVTAIGNYSVVAVIGGCSSMVATTYVSVLTTLNPSSNAPICAGQNLNLSINNIIGAAFSWTGPNGFTSSLSSPVITAASNADSGMYSVTVSLAGCGTMGPYSVLAAVNKIPAAPVAGSNGPLCAGDNLNLTSSSYAGGSYSWTGPNNFISNQQNPTRPNSQASHSGTYNVILTANGCNSLPGSVSVLVNNVPGTPVAGNNGPLCNSQSLSLTSTAIPNATYAWSGPNNFTSTSQNPTRSNITTLDAGTYSLIATVNGCPSQTATTSVAITTNTPSPVVTNNGPLCPAQTFQLSASAIPGASYAWTGPNGFTSSLQNPSIDSIDLSHAGIYSVTATTLACGTSSAATTTLVVNNLPSAPTINNNSPLCDGSTINLSASSVTGATYTWTGPNNFSSTLQNPSISNADKTHAGEYTVYISVAGCGNSPASVTTVKINRIPATPNSTSNGAVCTNDTLKLSGFSPSAGPNALYKWTGPDNFSANGSNVFISNATSNNAGLYELTVTDSNCTSAVSGTTASIKPLPPSPVASSNSPICDGATLLLSAGAVNGATYQWTGVNGYKSGSQNPVISGTNTSSSGTYEVVSVVNGCKSVPASTTVLVNALPAKPIVSDSVMKCIGEDVNLTAQSSQGVSYSWSGPGGFTSNQQNISLSNLKTVNAGVYQVIASTLLCSSLPSGTKLIVNLPPAAPVVTTNPAGNACIGDSIQLYATFVSEGSYKWTGPAGFSSLAERPLIKSVTAANSGTYSATVSRYGCVSPAGTVSVAVQPLPVTGNITGDEVARQNEIHTYSVTGPATSTYTWTLSNGGSIVSGDGTSSVNTKWAILTSNGSVKVTETSLYGCKGSTSNFAMSVVKKTGLDDFDFTQGDIMIYPNPASTFAILDFNLTNTGNALIKFTDVLGKHAITDSKLMKGQGTVNYNLSGLSKGIYFVTIELNNELKTLKLVIQ